MSVPYELQTFLYCRNLLSALLLAAFFVWADFYRKRSSRTDQKSFVDENDKWLRLFVQLKIKLLTRLQKRKLRQTSQTSDELRSYCKVCLLVYADVSATYGLSQRPVV